MVDVLYLYISAAQDLELEREVLGKAVVDIPVTLGWRVVQSPIHGEPVDLNAVARADVHILLLGGDIRAPIGVEWLTSRRAGRQPILFLKQDISRTPAARAFIRHLEAWSFWRTFKDVVDLRRQFYWMLADHVLRREKYYALSGEESERLKAWLKEMEDVESAEMEEMYGGTGESSVLLSAERFMPSKGVLIQPPEEPDTSEKPAVLDSQRRVDESGEGKQHT